MTIDYLQIARDYVAELVAGGRCDAAAVYGSAVTGATHPMSDIDMAVYARSMQGYRCEPATRGGVFIDLWSSEFPGLDEIPTILSDPFQSSKMRDCLILHDSDGTLGKIKEAVCEEFAEPKWVQARLAGMKEPIAEAHHRAKAAETSAALLTALLDLVFLVPNYFIVRNMATPTSFEALAGLRQVSPAHGARFLTALGGEAISNESLTRAKELIHTYGPEAAPPDWEHAPHVEHLFREFAWKFERYPHDLRIGLLWFNFFPLAHFIPDEGRRESVCGEFLSLMRWKRGSPAERELSALVAEIESDPL